MNRLPYPAALLLLVTAPAAAQEINAQRFTPSVDGQTFLVLNHPSVGGAGVGGGMTVSYADDPFIYRFEDEDLADIALLDGVATANLLGFANLGRVRLGVDVPLHLASSGYGVDGFRLLGDLGVDGKVSLLSREHLGLGARARVTLPTGNGNAWLGDAHPSVTTEVLAATGERVIVAANAGFRVYGGGAVELPDVSWGSRFTYGAGVSVPVWDPISATAELTGEMIFGSGGAPGAFPLEGLVSLRGEPQENLVASLGLGAGLTQGIGAPDFRVVAGVGWVPGRREVATDAVTARVVSDRDGDGIADTRDLCPDQAEDYNGTADDDGCPEAGLTPTRLLVRDEQGAQVAGAGIELLAGPETGRWSASDGELVRSLPPGTYRVRASGDGYIAHEDKVVVPEAPRHEATLTLSAEAAMGTVTLTVLDDQGQPVAARARLLGTDVEINTASDGVSQDRVPAGTWEVVVSAPGHTVARRTLRVEPDGTASLDVLLQRERVVVTEDRIVILDRVFFEFDSAVIKPESFGILDEVVATLKARDEIELVEVQGHTDDQGAADYNRELSQRRAEAVRAYLVKSGVAPDRLIARGYGEDRPLQSGETPDVRATNRRVEFVIHKRAQAAR